MKVKIVQTYSTILQDYGYHVYYMPKLKWWNFPNKYWRHDSFHLILNSAYLRAANIEINGLEKDMIIYESDNCG